MSDNSTRRPSPTDGHALLMCQARLGLSTGDMQSQFGVSATKWSQITRQTPDLPLPDPAAAIMARLLYNRPELCQIPPQRVAADAYTFFNYGREITLKEFGMVLGRDSSAGYRWVSKNNKQNPLVAKLLDMVVTMAEQQIGRTMDEIIADNGETLSVRDRNAIRAVWDYMRDLADQEAAAVGISIDHDRRWPRKHGTEDGDQTPATDDVPVPEEVTDDD